MTPPTEIEFPAECNRDLILGQVVQAVNGLIRQNNSFVAQNKAEHDKIFARLDEGDKYLFVLKASSCTFSWLNRNGVLKWGLIGSIFTAAGWLLGHVRIF